MATSTLSPDLALYSSSTLDIVAYLSSNNLICELYTNAGSWHWWCPAGGGKGGQLWSTRPNTTWLPIGTALTTSIFSRTQPGMELIPYRKRGCRRPHGLDHWEQCSRHVCGSRILVASAIFGRRTDRPKIFDINAPLISVATCGISGQQRSGSPSPQTAGGRLFQWDGSFVSSGRGRYGPAFLL